MVNFIVSFMRKTFIALVLVSSFAIIFGQKSAKAEIPANFTKEQIFLLQTAEDYIASLRTFQANFLQVNPGSTAISSGEIIISKPGQLKMSYAAPFEIDYYINGDNVTQYDRDLDEVSRGIAPDNPLKVLLYDGVLLAKNDIMNVSNIVDYGDRFDVFMLNKTNSLREITGLILKFEKTPIGLIGIERVDLEGNKTETNFTSINVNKEIDDSELRFKREKPSYPSQR